MSDGIISFSMSIYDTDIVRTLDRSIPHTIGIDVGEGLRRTAVTADSIFVTNTFLGYRIDG